MSDPSALSDNEFGVKLTGHLSRLAKLADIDPDSIEALKELRQVAALTEEALREERAGLRRRIATIDELIGPEAPPPPAPEAPKRAGRGEVLAAVRDALANASVQLCHNYPERSREEQAAVWAGWAEERAYNISSVRKALKRIEAERATQREEVPPCA